MPFIDTVTNKTFEQTSILLTGIRFKNCRFVNCQLIYAGDESFAFEDCNFEACEWTFHGPAENTLVFLSELYNGLGDEGRQLVESVFESIRARKVKDQTIPLIPRSRLRSMVG